MLYTFYRILKFSFQGFWRNFWLSVVTISVIVLAFASVNFLVIINIVTESAVQLVRDNIDVSIYFKADAEEAIIQEAQEKLSTLPEIESVVYVSKEQALDEFRMKHKDDPLILESLEEFESNPLNATLRIKAKDIGQYPVILEFVNNSKYNDYITDKNFEDHKEYINRIHIISQNIIRFGIIVSVIFMVISLLIVFNTIKLAIYSQREEIAIMKLVGASNTFISSPYIVESILYAIFGCIFAVIITFVGIDLVQPHLHSYFGGSTINLRSYFNNHFWLIFGSELIALSCLNIIASGIAVRRYLKI